MGRWVVLGIESVRVLGDKGGKLEELELELALK
jgi:hypothetical protein